MSHFISCLLTFLTTYKNPVTTPHFRYLVDLYPRGNRLEACLAGAGSTGEPSSVRDDETRTWYIPNLNQPGKPLEATGGTVSTTAHSTNTIQGPLEYTVPGLIVERLL